MKYVRSLALLLGLSVIGGCSSTFLYNQLDWLIPWYVDDYVDLTREQKKGLKEQLRPLLRWHRQEELAQYRDILDGIEEDLQRPVTGADVQSWADAMLGAWERIEERMLPIAFDLGAQLSDKQMAEFIGTLQERQVELEEEYLYRTEEEFTAESFESFEENLGDFLGRLSEEQELLLHTAASSLLRFDSAWLEERRAWLEQLEVLLQREPGWEQQVRLAKDELERSRTPEYRQAYAHNQQIINDSIAAVLNVRTDKQSLRLQRDIDDIRRDLNKLIAQAAD